MCCFVVSPDPYLVASWRAPGPGVGINLVNIYGFRWLPCHHKIGPAGLGWFMRNVSLLAPRSSILWNLIDLGASQFRSLHWSS
jgi:hypothetical protein